ncbi:hypothetical protein HPB48_013532 [Haemaphysalis longicornis]|uniref:Uncharacterized protein n=1 Tax=Haemaphysalis longicornis TaxID=44386 RepID=A0A9J6FRZ5_HAELO|nr:hypothetical protein HPB48_013532 [Haemaphysalis longicornis]
MGEKEAVVNSRPLTFVERSINKPKVITPAHFIIGKRLTSLPTVSAQLCEQNPLQKVGKSGNTANNC